MDAELCKRIEAHLARYPQTTIFTLCLRAQVPRADVLDCLLVSERYGIEHGTGRTDKSTRAMRVFRLAEDAG